MAISPPSIIQQRWPKSLNKNNNNRRPPSPSNPQDHISSGSSSPDNGNAKQRLRGGDYLHALVVFWNNTSHRIIMMMMHATASLGGRNQIRSMGVTMILCSILGILLFHPPCYRRRAQGMPLCRVSRDMGFIPPLSGTKVAPSSSISVTSMLPLDVFRLQPQERTRILLGFMSSGNDQEERQRRQTIRQELLLARDIGKRVCCLQDYLLDPEKNRGCSVVYAFLQGGNPDGTHLEFNRTYDSMLQFQETSFFAEAQEQMIIGTQTEDGHIQQKEEDVFFLNVQDINNIRKVFAWLDYSMKVRMERGRKFDYVGFTNTQFTIKVDTFLSNFIFQSNTTVQHTYGGIQTQKAQCSERYNSSNRGNCTSYCLSMPKDSTFMSDLVVLSRDLVGYCLGYNNLVQLSGLYPQDCPDLAVANLIGYHPSEGLNITHLSGVIHLP